MSDLVWVDPIDRVGNGQKRHAYEAVARGQETGTSKRLRRLCGVGDNASPVGMKTTADEMERVKATFFAVDQNACLSCVRAMNLKDYRETNLQKGGGAETVRYDPFGVFTEDDNE